MFQPIASLFEKKEQDLSTRDLRHFVEDYFYSRLKSEAVYCQDVIQGRVVIRVTNPVLRQGVKLLEYDLRNDMRKETGYAVSKIEIIYC